MIERSGRDLTRAGLLLAALMAASALPACRPPIPPPASVLGIPVRPPPEVRPPRSVVFTAVELPLEEVTGAIERAIPADLGGRSELGLGALGKLAVRWNVRRGPAELVAELGALQLRLAMVGDVVLELWPLRCTSPGFGVTVEVSATPRLTRDGRLILEQPRAQRRWVGQVRCAGQTVPLDRGLDALLTPALRGVERALAAVQVPLGPLLEGGLALLAEPRTLSLRLDGQASTNPTLVCLDLAPGGLVMAPLGGARSRPEARLGVEVSPRVELGACETRQRRRRGRPPAVLTVRPLDLGPSFRTQVAVAVPHAELTARLRTAAVGQTFGPAGQQLRIHDLEVGDAGGQVLVTLHVSGALEGRLRLWGTPTVAWRDDGAGGRRLLLTVPDLRAALETTSLLRRLQLGLLALTGGSLADRLKQALRVDVTDQLAGIQRALVSRFQVPAGGWRLQVETQLVADPLPVVRSEPGALVVIATLGGRALLGPAAPATPGGPLARNPLPEPTGVLFDPGAKHRAEPKNPR